MQAFGQIDLHSPKLNPGPKSEQNQTDPQSPPNQPPPNPKEQANQEFEKEKIKKEKQDEEKLELLLEKADKVLYQLKTAKPLEIFPTEIVIDANKITVKKATFFSSDIIRTFPVKDLQEAEISTDLFFAKLTLVIQNFHEGPLSIEYLKKKEALDARKIIQGLIIVNKEGIELSNIPDEELAEKMAELGEGKVVEEDKE